MKNIILASASPRRREIMDKLNLPYKVVISHIKEEMDESLPLEERIEQLAYQKAMAVFKEHEDCLVVGGDTVVEIDGEVLGKPRGLSEAREMIKKLSGREHRVVTGYAIVTKEEAIIDHDEALVTFVELDDKEIEDYIQTREPYDKAGGYAIQGWASCYISKIEGSYYTVMGLPLHKVYQKLKGLGYYEK